MPHACGYDESGGIQKETFKSSVRIIAKQNLRVFISRMGSALGVIYPGLQVE